MGQKSINQIERKKTFEIEQLKQENDMAVWCKITLGKQKSFFKKPLKMFFFFLTCQPQEHLDLLLQHMISKLETETNPGICKEQLSEGDPCTQDQYFQLCTSSLFWPLSLPLPHWWFPSSDRPDRNTNMLYTQKKTKFLDNYFASMAPNLLTKIHELKSWFCCDQSYSWSNEAPTQKQNHG